jgi:succinate dehydrogenase / fumarate reductase cytochrome b subunit
VAGVLAASFHFGNGLWGFAIHWGLLTSKAAQRRWSWAALLVALVFAVAGVNSLLAFGPLGGLRPVRLQPAQAAEAPPAAPVVPEHGATR